MAQAVANELAALPTFWGPAVAGQQPPPKGASSAEEFFYRMEAYTATINFNNEAARIARVVSQFRGQAALWWRWNICDENFQEVRYDCLNAQTTWIVFAETFKREFFAVGQFQDAVDDITNLKMQQGESVQAYFNRVRWTRAPADKAMLEHFNGALTDDAIRNLWPANYNATLLADPYPAGAEAAAIAAARHLAQRVLRKAMQNMSFLAIGRHVAATAASPHVRTSVRKHLFAVDFNLSELERLAVKDSKDRQEQPTHAAPVVAALDPIPEDDALDDAFSDPPSADEDDVAALRVKKGRKKKSRQPKAQAQHQARSRTPATSAPARTSTQSGAAKPMQKQPPFCIWCQRRGNHITRECPFMRQARETGPGPMDTSAAAHLQAAPSSVVPAAPIGDPSVADRLARIEQQMASASVQDATYFQSENF